MKKILFILSLFFFVSANAQDGDYDAFLARQFLQNGELEKAAEYYEGLFNQHPQEYYEEYLKVLVQLKQFDKAEKVIKTLYKESSDPLYLLDLADLYLQQNRESDAEKQFNKTIKELKPDKYNINQVAQKFIKLKQLDYAQKTYTRGKEILKDRNAFNLEIANLYLLKNDFLSMINAYLDEAPYQSNDLTVIENGLQKGLIEEKEKDALEKELLKRIQSDKSQFVYQDILVWLYMQRNDFDGAVLQAKSLDMLRNEDGENVMRISKTAAEQKDFDAAIRGYQYVIDKGSKYSWYVTANLEMINVKRDKLVNSPNYNREQLLSLKDTYKAFIQNYNNDYTVTNAIIELAQLEALYIHEIDSAIELLIPITENNRLAKDLLAKSKLYLGDYYLIADQPWESILLYTQVEKEQKGNPVSEEAMFRNAKLSYYKGDFEWAQTQLKIIKASTSELISNDAIDLSVFILDNLNSDTIDYALLKFAKADLLRYQNKLDEAEDTLNEITQNYKSSALTDDILYIKYKIEKDRQHYDKAAGYLQQIADNFSTDILGDNAVFYLGDLYQNFLKDDEKAKGYYEKLILDYKDSTFAIEARKRYRKLRGENVN
ncbi:MAG: Tetratricopeptide 2 repeat-containing protein [Bacteroidota bacterium]|nr:Tetratricopeptide 2 repeat-containing protein [Bacteroidota bacterium]